MNNKNVWANILFLIASNFNFLKYKHTIIVNVQHAYCTDGKRFPLIFKNTYLESADSPHLYLSIDQVIGSRLTNTQIM